MRKMMDSIMKSLPGMAIAFSALFLIMGIYAIIGVSFWMETFPDEFGNFLKVVLSLLQIMTFDSWCSGIARKVIFAGGVIEAIYFISYVFIASIIMANVLIALLLDEFMNTSQDVDNEPEADVGLELDKKLDKEHEERAKEVLQNPEHLGLSMMSMMQTKDYRLNVRKETQQDETGNAPNRAGGKADQVDIEMQQTNVGAKRKPGKKSTQEVCYWGKNVGSRSGPIIVEETEGCVKPVGHRGELVIPEEQEETNGSCSHKNHIDSAWRTRVEQNIKTLNRSLETFHSRFEQLDGKLDQLDFRLSGFFAL